jgi:hypothetical protein
MACKEQEKGGENMKYLPILFLSACVLATVTRAQTPEAAAHANNASLQVETTKSIDAKKAKVGDQVTAVLTQDVLKKGKIVLPRGSKIKGHISEAQPRTKENPESRLGFVFDKVVAKGAGEVDCACTVAAVAPPMEHEIAVYQSGNMGVPQAVSQPRSTRGNVRGRSGRVVATPTGYTTVPGPNTVPSSGDANNRASKEETGALSSGSRGVIGLEDLRLTSSGSGASASVLISEKKNVKLESGTQMVLLISEQDKK